MIEMMRCPKCRADNSTKREACYNCGTVLGVPAPSPASDHPGAGGPADRPVAPVGAVREPPTEPPHPPSAYGSWASRGRDAVKLEPQAPSTPNGPRVARPWRKIAIAVGAVFTAYIVVGMVGIVMGLGQPPSVPAPAPTQQQKALPPTPPKAIIVAQPAIPLAIPPAAPPIVVTPTPPEPQKFVPSNTMAWTMAQEFVRDRLKAPRSAVFSYGFLGLEESQDIDKCVDYLGEVPLRDGTPVHVYWVHGWVDAQNAFGATIRNNFGCALMTDGDGHWSCVDVRIEPRE
jgi:hypothetical protein